MKIKRILIILLVALFSLAVLAPSSWAGSVQQHRLEGIAIGIGALIIGKAILDAHHSDHYAQAHVATHTYTRPVGQRPHGRWETQRIWVPATYHNVRSPGYHSRNGHWVSGHWKRVVSQPGHWTTQRTTVGRR